MGGSRYVEVYIAHGTRWMTRERHGGDDVAISLVDGPPFVSDVVQASMSWAEIVGWDAPEGGVLVDRDTSTLLWFGGPVDGLVHHRILVELVGRRWPGWTVRHADRGLADFAAYLGEPYVGPAFDTRPDDVVEGTGFVLSGHVDGSCYTACFSWESERCLGDLSRAAAVLKAQGSTGPVRVDAAVHSGAHLEPERRRVTLWTRDAFDIEASVQRANPDWQVVRADAAAHEEKTPDLIWPRAGPKDIARTLHMLGVIDEITDTQWEERALPQALQRATSMLAAHAKRVSAPFLEIRLRAGKVRACWLREGGTRVHTQLMAGPRFQAWVHPLERGTWAEAIAHGDVQGAVLIDEDARVVLWFGDQAERPLYRRLVHAMLSEVWPGWRLRHATRGLTDIAAYLGMPDPAGAARRLPFSPAARFWVTNAVTEMWVCTDDARVLEDIVLAQAALEHAGDARLRMLPVAPSGGIHLVPTARTAFVWSLEPRAVACACPPGWRVVQWADEAAHRALMPHVRWPVARPALELERIVWDAVSVPTWHRLVRARTGRARRQIDGGALKLTFHETAAFLAQNAP